MMLFNPGKNAASVPGTPRKTNGWNPKISDLGRWFSFSFRGYVQVPAVSFQGSTLNIVIQGTFLYPQSLPDD